MKISSKTIALLGGDFRQSYLANYLSKAKYKVNTFKVPKQKLDPNIHIKSNLQEAIANSHIVIGPTPLSSLSQGNFSLEAILEIMDKNQLFIAGALTDSLKQIINSYSINYIDLLDNESLAIANAITTV